MFFAPRLPKTENKSWYPKLFSDPAITRKCLSHRSDKYLNPDIFDEDWITEVIKFIKNCKLLERWNNDQLYNLPTSERSKTSEKLWKVSCNYIGFEEHIQNFYRVLQKAYFKKFRMNFLHIAFWMLTRTLNVFLGEWSRTLSHKDTLKLFHFFPIRDKPLRFIDLNPMSAAPNGQICANFLLKVRQVHDLSFSKFFVAKVFYRQVITEAISIFNLKVQKKFFESWLYCKLGNADFCALIDGTPFNRAACCNIFRGEFFSASFCQKKFFWVFLKQLWRSRLGAAFLTSYAHFLPTYL